MHMHDRTKGNISTTQKINCSLFTLGTNLHRVKLKTALQACSNFFHLFNIIFKQKHLTNFFTRERKWIRSGEMGKKWMEVCQARVHYVRHSS